MTKPRFYAYQYLTSTLDNGHCITLWTDIPCHLWVKWSRSKPTAVPITRQVRGAAFICDAFYSSRWVDSIQQTQPGDTLIHTFPLKLPTKLIDIYFYAYGTIAGITSPSTSPILTAKISWPPPPLNRGFNFTQQPVPQYWTRGHFGPGFSQWDLDAINFFEPPYSLRMRSLGYATMTYVTQSFDATPYHYQSIKATAWGKGYAYSNNDLNFSHNGTPPASEFSTLTESGVWQQKAVTLYIPPSATLLTIAVRCYSGPEFIIEGRWDKVQLEVP